MYSFLGAIAMVSPFINFWVICLKPVVFNCKVVRGHKMPYNDIRLYLITEKEKIKGVKANFSIFKLQICCSHYLEFR